MVVEASTNFRRFSGHITIFTIAYRFNTLDYPSVVLIISPETISFCSTTLH